MVLIAGAGPVGLTLAIALRRLDVPVRIVDSNGGRTDKSKALVLWPRTLELLDIEADGYADSFVTAGIEGQGARIYAEGRELVHVDLTVARSRYHYALLIPQSETERLLEARLQALGGAVERNTTLAAFAATADGVRATLQTPQGSTQTVDCAYLCGCDGAHSVVRHGLGLAFDGSSMQGSWLLADAHVSGALSARELTLAWTHDGVLALFPIVGNRVRVLADVPPTPGDDPPTLAEIQAVLDARAPMPLRVSDPVWLSRFHINERKVADYSRGRVYLAGDAAHIHSPAGGQGMNTGMQDAFNLAWKLAAVSKGHASPALLDTYSPERSRVGDEVLRNAGRLTDVALVRNPVLQELRNLAASALGQLAAFRQRMVDQLTEIDIAYPTSTLTHRVTGEAHVPAPGGRAEDVLLRDAQGRPGRLHALLRDGRFVLMAIGAPAPEVPAGLQDLVQSATVEDTARYAAGHVFLVRPDAYVSASGPLARSADVAAVAARFAA